MAPAKQPEAAGASSEEFGALLLRHLGGAVVLDERQVEALWEHWRLLQRWNSVLNLSAVRDLEGAIVKHYCESLFLGSCIGNVGARVVDAGSGAGFPGVPIAVLLRDSEVLLVESHRRKASFLKEAVRKLPNAEVFAGRLEDLDGHFDWLVSRAVAWRRFRRDARRLAEHVGLLMSSAGAKEAAGDEGFQWKAPLPMPWGKECVVAVADVSRGTS